jgi:hypothetical protein
VKILTSPDGNVELIYTRPMFRRTTVGLLTVLLIGSVAFSKGFGTAKLVRRYGHGDFNGFSGLSQDGKYLLVTGEPLVDCGTNGSRCRKGVLSVYDTTTGKLIWNYMSSTEWPFAGASFIGATGVLAIEHDFDRVQKVSTYDLLQWDLSSGSHSHFSLDRDQTFSPACVLDGTKVIGRTFGSPRAGITLLFADQSGIRELKQPPLPLSVFGVVGSTCLSSFWNGTMLLPSGMDPPPNAKPEYFSGRGQKTDLYWISTTPEEPRFCCSITDEFLQGHAVSRDGKLIVAITGYEENPELMGFVKPADGRVPRRHVFLNLIDSDTGSRLRRSELEFPEGELEWERPILSPFLPIPAIYHRITNDHVLSRNAVAVSPDKKKVAVAYSWLVHSDGVARIGIYSLPEGRRLTTLTADTYHVGFFRTALRGGDEHWADIAPIGQLEFSPDSRTLFVGSERVWQWDVSGLQ